MNDLDIVRIFCAEEAPPPGRLAAVRARVVAGFDAGSKERRGPRALRTAAGTRWRGTPGPVRLALTGAVATVLAGAVAAVLIIPGAGGRAATPSAVRLDAAAVAVLHRAARAALATPSPGANEFIYVATRVHDPQNYVNREWMSISRGAQRVAQVPSCGSVLGGAFRHDPGCWLSPLLMDWPFTYTGLQRLPTPARKLLGYLSAEQHRACGVLGKRMNQAEREWSGIYTILNNVPVLPPHFGAALFDAAAQIPGVRVIRNVWTAAGQPGIAVARTVQVRGGSSEASQAELIFSPRTYRYIGNVLHGDYPGPRRSSALITTRFTSTYPHHSRPQFGFMVAGCIDQVATSGS